MLHTDIIDTWTCYKISNGEREEFINSSDTSQMTFLEDGRLLYKLSKDHITTYDSMERHWKIDYRDERPVLAINEERVYYIISLEGSELVLEGITGSGIRHHYANNASYPSKVVS